MQPGQHGMSSATDSGFTRLSSLALICGVSAATFSVTMEIE